MVVTPTNTIGNIVTHAYFFLPLLIINDDKLLVKKGKYVTDRAS